MRRFASDCFSSDKTVLFNSYKFLCGIPVVKTFGQSVFSIKRFKASIDQYKKWVIAYTIDLRRPMTLYTTFVNASFAVLIALTLIVVKNGTYSPEFLMNLLYYIIVTPVIAVKLNRLMFASENEMIVAEALEGPAGAPPSTPAIWCRPGTPQHALRS